MSKIWFYEMMGEEVGPVSSGQLRELAQSGKILPYTRVRHKDRTGWNTADQLKGLFDASAPAKKSRPAPAGKRAKASDANPQGHRIFRKGRSLVFYPDSVFPNRCVWTNKPVQKQQRCGIYDRGFWAMLYFVSWFFLGVLGMLIVSKCFSDGEPLCRLKMPISSSYAKDWRRRRDKNDLINGIGRSSFFIFLMLTICFVIGFIAAAQNGSEPIQKSCFYGGIICYLLLLPCMLMWLLNNAGISLNTMYLYRRSDQRMVLHHVSREFIMDLPTWSRAAARQQ